MKDRKPVEKQNDRISVLIRLNEFTKNIVESGYKEWEYNSQQEFYTTAVKDLVDKHLNQFTRGYDDEVSEVNSFNTTNVETNIKFLNEQIRSLNELNERNFKIIAILLSYVAMSSAGYLTFMNREELILPIKGLVKNEFNNIEDTNIDQLFMNLLDKKYDGFKNSSHH